MTFSDTLPVVSIDTEPDPGYSLCAYEGVFKSQKTGKVWQFRVKASTFIGFVVSSRNWIEANDPTEHEKGGIELVSWLYMGKVF